MKSKSGAGLQVPCISQ